MTTIKRVFYYVFLLLFAMTLGVSIAAFGEGAYDTVKSSVALLIVGGIGAYALRTPSEKPPSITAKPAPKPKYELTASNQQGLDKHDFFIFKELSNKIIANDHVSLDEALALQSFLYKNGGYEDDRTRDILNIIDDVLFDGVIDAAESEELTTILGEFIDNIDSPPQATEPSIKPYVTYTRSSSRTIVSRSNDKLETKKSYFISYVDAKGASSEREIFISSIKKNKAGNTIVYARCKLANSTRSFRLDRIIEAVDAETGEVLI